MPPGMDPLKAVSYMNNKREKEEQKQRVGRMEAAVKASQGDSRKTRASEGVGVQLSQKKPLKNKTKAKVRRSTTKMAKEPATLVAPSKEKVGGTPTVVPKVAVPPAVPTEEKRSGCDEVPEAGDKSFCTHYAVHDLVTTPCCFLSKRQNDHYTGEGKFLYGVSCKECSTPAKDVKKTNGALDGNVAYMCEMGQKAFVVHEDSRHLPYYTKRECQGSYLCYACAHARVSKVDNEQGGGAGRRSRCRRRSK